MKHILLNYTALLIKIIIVILALTFLLSGNIFSTTEQAIKHVIIQSPSIAKQNSIPKRKSEISYKKV